MDVKVYKKETVKQPSGTSYVISPNIIDLYPIIVEQEKKQEINNNTWSLDDLSKIADVKIKNGKLIINSDKVTYENGTLFVRVTDSQLVSVELLEDGSHSLLEQQCALATIWQKGLDPLDLEEGIRWSEAILEEINVVQLMEDITNAVAEITPTVAVVFDTVTDNKGNSYLTYTLKEVA